MEPTWATVIAYGLILIASLIFFFKFACVVGEEANKKNGI